MGHKGRCQTNESNTKLSTDVKTTITTTINYWNLSNDGLTILPILHNVIDLIWNKKLWPQRQKCNDVVNYLRYLEFLERIHQSRMSNTSYIEQRQLKYTKQLSTILSLLWYRWCILFIYSEAHCSYVLFTVKDLNYSATQVKKKLKIKMLKIHTQI